MNEVDRIINFVQYDGELFRKYVTRLLQLKNAAIHFNKFKLS